MRVLFDLEYQRNFSGRAGGVVVVDAPSNDIEVRRPMMSKVREALPKAKPGDMTHIH